MITYIDLFTNLETNNHDIAMEWFRLHHNIAIFRNNQQITTWEW